MDAPLGLPESSCRFIGSRRTAFYLPRQMRLAISGEGQERPRDEKDYHCLVTFPLMLDLSDLECRSSASGVPERAKRWRIAFSVTP